MSQREGEGVAAFDTGTYQRDDPKTKTDQQNTSQQQAEDGDRKESRDRQTVSGLQCVQKEADEEQGDCRKQRTSGDLDAVETTTQDLLW